MAMGFRIKREIDFGDLLTPLSILIALATVILTWQTERNARLKSYADGIRKSSSTVSAKLERWGTLADRYYDDVQPTLLAVSVQTANNHQYKPARAALFGGLREAEGKASQRILDEQLEIAYMELYGYVPSLKPPFDKIREDITSETLKSHRKLEKKLQTILGQDDMLQASDSHVLGDALRSETLAERQELAATISKITNPLRENILKLINLPDGDLADPNKREAQSAIFK